MKPAQALFCGLLWCSDAALAANLDATVYAYHQTLPSQNTLEARLGFKAEHESLRTTARAMLLEHEAYLSAWQLRYKLNDDHHLAVGRDVLNWGAGQYRSPASPFYFDNGRSNPLRELSGVDMAKWVWTPNQSSHFLVAQIQDTGYRSATNDMWRSSQLMKYECQFEAGNWGVLAVRSQRQNDFYGTYGQYLPNEAWRIYAEANWQTRLTSLTGFAYTRESGDTLFAEWLNQPNSIHFAWQSNLLESEQNYRVMYTHHRENHLNELSFYSEKSVQSRLSVYLSGSVVQLTDGMLRSAVVGVRVVGF